MMERIDDLTSFNEILGELRQTLGGTRTLAKSSGRMDWPARGVYLFFEPGEERSDSGSGPRVVRVGTHALTTASGTTLWNRLSQHRGTLSSGRGNHRGSIFRLLVGDALMRRDSVAERATWGRKGSAGAVAADTGRTAEEVRRAEYELEAAVSRHICSMPFLWLAVDDDTDLQGARGYVERNSIALLSNYGKPALDAPSASWLGHHSGRERVRTSGLWNNNHVDEGYDAGFLDKLQKIVRSG